MSSPEAIFDILIRRGQLSAAPAPTPLAGGNDDRRATRSSWKATAADGSAVKLTLGTDLSLTSVRHRAAHTAAPDFVPAPVFFERLPEGDVFAEKFITASGPTERSIDLFTEVTSRLNSTLEPSTAAARRNEWQRWTAGLLEIDAFTEEERSLLSKVVFPSLFRQLASGSATTRWTNGDLRAGNILVDKSGRPWLIDHEHGTRTHFFGEDDVRWFAFSANKQSRAASVPSSTALNPAWNLYFWLRQFELEVRGNTLAYQARMSADRKAVIRYLAEWVCKQSLGSWSTNALPLHFALEDVRWLQHEEMTIFVSGWCHLPGNHSLESLHLVAPDDAVATLEQTIRPDVCQHFGTNSDGKVAGFSGRIATSDLSGRILLGARRADGAWFPLTLINPEDSAARGPSTGNYSGWAARFDTCLPRSVDETSSPCFSVLVPVYNTPASYLQACIASIFAQTHRIWELIIVDDGSTEVAVGEFLKGFPADPRVRLTQRAQNGGIARATNDALDAAQGDFVVLLDHDDVLRPHALQRLALAISREPAVDVWYSDEDKISEEGRRLFPFFKPAFSPEFLRGVMYPGHVLCVRRSVARAVGGFDPAFDGVQDYEFFLRLSEYTPRVGHLPEILYHWRRSPGSSALHGNVKGDMDARQLAAVYAHLARRGDARIAESIGGHRIRLRANRKMSLPTLAITSIAGAENPLDALRKFAMERTEHVVVAYSHTPLCNDPAWADELAVVAALSDSGCVAPVMISQEQRILESGCTFANGRLVPMMVNFDPDDDGYNGAGRCNREVLAVSPLCVAVRREVILNPHLASATDWCQFLVAANDAGLYHRVCASARVNLPLSGSCHTHPWSAPANCSDPYYNPAFRRSPADYSFLAHIPPDASRSITVHHLDTPLPDVLEDGCLEVRGWCVFPDGSSGTVFANIAGIDWSVPASILRPDVARTLGLSQEACGFSLNLRLPPGNHRLALHASNKDGHTVEIATQSIRVPRLAALRRAYRSPSELLLACQLAATPQYAPRPLALGFPRRLSSTLKTGPRFAIVTPSYQQAAFLRETIASVLNQGVPGDYVIQDGGSTDGSVAIIDEFARNRGTSASMRLATWESEPDAGQTDALQRGFAKTNGAPTDLMAWINSDDFYLPGAFSFVSDFFARHPDVDVIYGHRLIVDGSSSEVGRWYLPAHDPDVLRLYDFVPQETLFWRRRVWDKVGGLNLDFQFAMDWDLLLRFQATGAKIVRIPRFLACFRIHPVQKTSSQLGSIGQEELDTLRYRTFRRVIPPAELVGDPRLISYLRRSARLELVARRSWFGLAG